MSLDREIEDLLSVDPSPEFIAKVRARVAAEPAPGRWGMGWKLTPAAAACAAVVVAALTMWPGADAPNVSEKVTRPAVPVSTSVRTPLTPQAAPAPQRRLPVAARAHAVPEIVVSDEEIRSFRLLLTQVQQGRIPEVPDVGSASAGEPLGPPWIEVSPVVITPIAQLAQPEGERQ